MKEKGQENKRIWGLKSSDFVPYFGLRDYDERYNGSEAHDSFSHEEVYKGASRETLLFMYNGVLATIPIAVILEVVTPENDGLIQKTIDSIVSLF